MVRIRPERWARHRRTRRLEAAVAHRVNGPDRLGPNWHFVEIRPAGPDLTASRTGLLAIGPGGVYAITVIDQAGRRVLVAGDVVQTDGTRPAYVDQARREAARVGQALSAAAGRAVPVTPVLMFIGTGVISTHGLPKQVLIATEDELDRVLLAGGARMSPATAGNLRAVAELPATWANATGPADR